MTASAKRWPYVYPFAIAAGSFLIGITMTISEVSPGTETPGTVQPISVLVRTDREEYSVSDTVRLYVSLQNSSHATTYVDRRMFWGGFGGGLKLEINDNQGNLVPSSVLNDAVMPPPREGDMAILVRLDSGFFYGTWLDLPVKDSFPGPGRYSIGIIYKSWLRKEFVARQHRHLPAIWADTPEIVSERVWIEIEGAKR